MQIFTHHTAALKIIIETKTQESKHTDLQTQVAEGGTAIFGNLLSFFFFLFFLIPRCLIKTLKNKKRGKKTTNLWPSKQ